MDFMVSKAHEKDSEQVLNYNGNVSRQLLLKSAGKMDRDVVLRRIRYHKRLNKLKNTFHALATAGSSANFADGESSSWLHQEDVFSSP